MPNVEKLKTVTVHLDSDSPLDKSNYSVVHKDTATSVYGLASQSNSNSWNNISLFSILP